MRTRTLINAASVLTCSFVSSIASAQCGITLDNPKFDSEGAGFGTACALSADGTIALVSGPGYDLGDGLVRTFERVGDTWTEGLALPAHVFFGDAWGFGIAMDDAGTRAIITSPTETRFSPTFIRGIGAAYIYERDPKTGDWAQTHKFDSPVEISDANFGSSCDMTPDGLTVVIGESNIIGTEFDALPDSAWVSEFDGSSWGALVELIPTPPPPSTYNYGQKVAISNDGTLIAVSAPQATAFQDPPESGIVYVFERQGSSWVQTDMLTRATDDSFNNFGRGIAFDGHDLLVVNPNESANGPIIKDGGAPVCIYRRDNGSYPSQPDVLFYPDANGFPVPGGFEIRGDRLMIKPASSGLRFYNRDHENPDQPWVFDSFYNTDSTEPFTGYGSGAAMCDDPEIFVVGEPGWQPDDFSIFQPGRIHFPDRVFVNNDFEINTASSSMQIDFDFPGLPVQSLFIQLLGFFNITFPENCTGGVIPLQAVIESFELMPDSPEYTLDGPLGSTIRLSEVVISLVEPSNPAQFDTNPFGGTQEASFTGMTVQVDAMVKIGALPAFPFSAQGDQTEPMVTQMTGGNFGQPLRFAIPQLGLDFEPDLGLGANNPTVSATGSVASTGPEPKICPADLNFDGDLDFIDIQAFIDGYTNFDPIADLNNDFEFDFIDIQAFLASYNSGCP